MDGSGLDAVGLDGLDAVGLDGLDAVGLDGVGVVTEASFTQQRLWFLDQLNPGSREHLLPLALRLTGPLDPAAFTAAFARVLARHDVLRTRYLARSGRPEPIVGAPPGDGGAAALTTLDLTTTEAERRDSAVAELLHTELGRPVDLTVGPLRAVLARFAPDDHLFVLVVHHIAFDGASWAVLADELTAGYREQVTGVPADLPPLPCQYADAAREQRRRLRGARLDRLLAHWQQALADLPSLALPADRPRPEVWEPAGDVVRAELPEDVVAAVGQVAAELRVTRFTVLLAAFEVLLSRHTGQRDLAIGTPVSGRGGPRSAGVVGPFVNSVVLRADTSGAPTFAELVHRVRDDTLAALSHAEAPFDLVVEALSPPRDLSRHPLFQVTFALLPGEAPWQGLPGVRAALVPTPHPGSPVDLGVELMPTAQGRLVLRLAYASALLDADTAEQLADDYCRLLGQLTADPDVTIDRVARRLRPLPARERGRLLRRGRGARVDIPALSLPELTARGAARTPHAAAVCGSGNSLGHAEVEERANRLARALRAAGVGRGSVVGVLLSRDPELVVAMLAVLKAGGAYLPLDRTHPTARLRALLTDAGADLLLCQGEAPAELTGPDLPAFAVDREQSTAGPGPGAPTAGPGPDDVAYVIHTSGSTGAPKGVVVTHRNVVAFLVAMQERLALRPGDTVVAVTTISFDPSVLELYLPLVSSARLVLADDDEARDPQRLAELLDRTRPTVFQATPTTLGMLVAAGWVAPGGLTVLSGGEPLPADLAARLIEGGAAVWDLYGPTETTVWASTARLDATGRPTDWVPAANFDVHVLDERLTPVPDGVVGEVYVGGAGVSLGYLGRPATTAGAFVPHPYASTPGARLYRTGDLARRRPDGSVQILGRRDHQVKIRGHRMEPGEIEAALRSHQSVRAAVVHPTPTGTGELQLTAYLLTDGEPPAVAELRELLLGTLPDYMLPGAFVVLDAFPLTVSGKVDRKALPLPTAEAAPAASARGSFTGSATESPAGPTRAGTPLEQLVAGVWREVLDREAVGLHEHFFEIGGHSLLATQIAVRLRSAVERDVPVRALFDHSTVAELAAALPGYPAAAERPALLARGARP